MEDLNSINISEEEMTLNIQTGKILPIISQKICISNIVKLSGYPVYEIKFSGCNLNCQNCDYESTMKVNDIITTNNLLARIKEVTSNYPELCVLFSGGEPLQYNRNFVFNHIANELSYINFFLYTNGSILIKDIFAENLHYIVECKTPSSKCEDSFLIENIKLLRLNFDCINFTMTKSDMDFVKQKIEEIIKVKPFIEINLSPTGDLTTELLSEFVISNKLPVHIKI